MNNTHTEKQIAKALEYSDAPEVLEGLLKTRLDIKWVRVGAIPSPWAGDEKLKALLYTVTLNGYSFPFYGSHVDAETVRDAAPGHGSYEFKSLRKRAKAMNDLRDGVLYSLLCCIRSDYTLGFDDMEDLGMDPDSINDVAKWKEWKIHSEQLRKVLPLSDSELNSLPQ